jgi:NinB protein
MKFILAHELARRRAMAAVADAPAGHVVTVAEPTRNLEQNALMWVLLQAFSDQLPWPVNGQMVKIGAEEWKDLLSAAFRQETVRVAMGLNGGMVMLGRRTSKMGKREMAEFIEFIQATAAERCVQLDEVTA